MGGNGESTPGDARYLTLPELSPYLNTERFENPKELFKHVVRKLKELTDPAQSYRLADIACANGEFLYYLKKEFPHWDLNGFDYEPLFLRVAEEFPGLEGIHFEVVDLMDMEAAESFDIVCFLGTISTIQEPVPVLERLLGLAKPGGHVFVDGYFSKYDVEVRSVYCDNSTPEGRGKWRVDWTQVPQSMLREQLAGKCSEIDFEEVVMGVELPRDPAKPHINAWTFKDSTGKNIITNGTNTMLNDVMLTMRK
jgi:SAM-dependent methyltransferase